MKINHRRRLLQMSLPQRGFVTVDDARELGVPPVELRKLAARGGIQRLGHGLYRFEDVLASPHDEFLQAVKTVGRDAYLVADAVLALHDLAFVNPRHIRVGCTRRVRRTLPPSVHLVHHTHPGREITSYDGIPSTTVAQAIRDCRGLVMRDRLRDAVDDALARGLVSSSEASSLHAELAA